MQSTSSIEESKSVKERSSKTSAKGAEASKVSKDSDKKAEQSLIDVEASVHHGDANESEQSLIADSTSDTVREDQTFGQGELKDVNEYLKGKVGADINAKKWLEGCEGLDKVEKSEVIIRLVYEVCLAKNIEYDLENDAAENEKENNKDRNFDTRRIFEVLKKVNRLLLPQDRGRLVELVCQKGNVKLLEMICQQENKDGGSNIKVSHPYSWKGKFTGYGRLTGLLQYVLKQPCSPEIVLCIAKKVYGNAHTICNGKQYLDSKQVAKMKGSFDYQDSDIKDCLKAAIELDYKDVVQVMLGGDIYRCIRLMKGEKFQEEKRFSEALKMIEETVAEVMSSWVCKQDLLKEVQGLLKEGIKVDINEMGRQDLINELESLGIEVKGKKYITKEELVKMLKEKGGGKVRLSKIVVGSLISTLFFNYRKELMEKPFELGISHQDKSRREKEINELNEKIDSKSFVKEKVLEKIKSLNSSSCTSNNRFFREVLSAIVNDEERLGKLKAVCTAICKEPMEKLLRGAKVYKDVIDALKFFGVEHNQTSIPKKIHSEAGVILHFAGDIENLVKGIRELKDSSLMADEVLEIAEGLAGNKVPAFSGLSRRTIIKLKNKRDEKGLTDDEAKGLKQKVLKIIDEIKRGIDILADGVDSEYCIDIEDVFRHFEIINSEIEEEYKREIVKFVCQNGNVKLLEMICQQENKDVGGNVKVNRQYSWKGEFTGYERLIDLLQHVLEQPCSPEIVLCIAKKVYGNAHIICNGKQYLDSKQVAQTKGSFDYQDSDIKDCLKAAIELDYKDVVQVMLGGDIYRCIRLMKGEKFQEEKRFSEALKMIEETVAEVMSSWVCKQDLLKEVQGLLKEGIEVDIKKMGKKELIDELESLGIEVKGKKYITKEELVKMLKKEGGGKVRLSKIVVGSLISTLFFNYRKELMEKPFELGISRLDKSRREKEINELNEKIDSKSFVKEKVLEKIKSLNSSSCTSNNRFFREVLSAIVNDEERLGKLKAVCTAICKEPMEKLLRGAKVHEDVVDILGFFGVDPLALEKSNVVASGNTSDIASSSQQPSTETSHDLPEIKITEPAEVKAKVLSSVPPGSKAAKKNNKYLMQNNYRRDGEFYYTAGTGSYLNSQNSPRGVMMDSKEKLSQLSLRREDSELILSNLPKIDRAMRVHGAGYKQRLLDKVLDYNRIVNHPYLQEGSSEGVSGTLGNSMNQSQQLDFSSLGDKELAAVKAYKDGVGLLKLGREKDGREEFKKAADKGFSHAGYVYAMMIFKEIVQHEMDNESRLPTKKDINKAVQYMINVKKEFFPFPSFVLGVMQSCTSFCKIFANKKLAAQVTSARECFEDILSNSDIGYSEGNYSFTVSRKYIVVEDGSEGYLKWVVQSAKYELARRIFLDEKLSLEELSFAKSLLEELSSDGFADAEYPYALALLKNAFGDEGDSKKRRNFNQAYDLLEQAINHGHKEAMFFFGTLPFRQEFKLLDEESQSCKGSHCFGYLEKYIETYGKDGEFKKDAAILIAAEYVKGKDSYVKYDEKEAKDILRENDCLDELQELEKKLQERQKRGKNVLPNVLGALEQVHSELKKNEEQSAQQLSSKVKELLDALRGSSLIIQQSPLLPSTLEQLRISSTLEQRSLLAPLEQLCYVLELQVDNQSHKEVLSSLQSLFSMCVELQMKRSNTQCLNPSEPSTTLQMKRSRSISPITSVSKQEFNPKSSSTMKGDEGVAGDSVFDATLDDKSTSNSNKSHVERELERRGRKREDSSIQHRI